ncbi:MAG: ABC transporter ATP-binding protein [Bryobacteraceae bacterium]|nr:ABC transporter ATP-binding protein [Bryobacteraceae bacterium]
MTALAFDGVSKTFDNGYQALAPISFDVAERRFVSLVGPSGCGKSTLLNLAAGLLVPSSGSIRAFGEALSGINRRAAYLFQQDTLLPWKTVRENAVLGLEFRGLDFARADTWIARVGLSKFAGAYPHELSGGMRKRASLAQALAVEPELLLMDEPFGALDIHTRQRMEQELLTMLDVSPTTVVFITHDLEEAIALSDEVLVLSAGPASRIVGRYPIDLPRPRALLDLKTEPRFPEIYRAIWHDLREEVLRSHDAR